jgi:hypothetical protein
MEKIMNFKRAFITLMALMLLPGLALAQVGDVTARFEVSKIWIDGDGIEDNLTTPVDVNITCTTGLPLSQDAVITSLVPTTFVLDDLISLDDVDCVITETVPTGFIAKYDANIGGEVPGGCVFKGGVNVRPDDVNDCKVINVPAPVDVTVYTEWEVINDGGDAVAEVSGIYISCNAPIAGISVGLDGFWVKDCLTLGDDHCRAVVVPDPSGSVCTTWDTVLDSSVEIKTNCGIMPISPGNGNGCTFYYTVFFEGIPTLSQYGLAIMALLMLGVGFVGFRRFV